ncbi:Cation/H(+) antiporter 15 [Spatholobus suberectus]|nr:Cation/H(+) antiporter 15 [Spatholobus suberectus]
MATSRGNGTVSSYYDSQGNWQVCVENDRDVGSYGIFLGDRPFDFVLPVTLCQLFIVIIISRTLCFLLRPLKTPKFICNVLGGIILGPTFLGRNKMYWQALFPPRQVEYLILTSIIGAIYFLWFIALKMDVIMTIRAAKSTWRLGVMPALASFVVMLALLSQHYNPRNISPSNIQLARISISCGMSMSNFPVVSDALIELNLIATELGQIALSSSMINDNILWFLLVLHRFASEKELRNSFVFLGHWLLFMFFSIFVVRPAVKLIARRTPVGKPVKEVYVVLILLGVLVMSGVGDVIGITFLMGPLIYGLVIPSGPPLGTTLVEKSEVLITEFLLPFFFVYVGMNTNLSALRDWRMFLTLQGVFFAGDLTKLLACVLVSLTYNIKPKHGTVIGLTLNIKGITQLIGFARLRKLQMLDDETFSQLVCCVVVITAIVTPLINLYYKHRPRVLHTPILYEGQPRTIQSTPRNTEFRIICCVHNEGNVRGVTSLLDSCNPMLESPICVYAIHLIELLGKSSPILLPIRRNKKFLSVNYPNTNHIMRAFENYSINSSGPVTVLPYVNVAPYKSMHDAICNLAQDKMVPFIITPFHENDNVDLVGHVAASIRKMNTIFQVHVPCTLGILVDRYSRLGACNNSNKFFNVGIFFLGGPDDREALALGIRMSERANTRVSLFRFIVNKKVCGSKFQLTREECEEEEADIMLDEGLIDEFKGMKYRDGNVSCYEIMVEDGVEVLDAIRSLEGNYDLVMVGRRHTNGSLNGEEMATFIENAEILGMLGDMLSSTEFCIGIVPVLVTQCGGMTVNNNKFHRLGSVNVSQKSLTVDK